MKHREGIFIPIFSTASARWLILLGVVFLGCLSFGVSEEVGADSLVYMVYEKIISSMADVSAMAVSSRFPISFAMSYGLAIVLSFSVAVYAAFSKLDMSKAEPVHEIGKVKRVLFFAFMVVVLPLPIFHALPVSDAHLTSGFFGFVARNRIGIFIWSAGYYLVSFLFWIWLIFEISNLFRGYKNAGK